MHEVMHDIVDLRIRSKLLTPIARVLYIASPIDDWDFVENVKKSVHRENHVVTGKDLEGLGSRIC